MNRSKAVTDGGLYDVTDMREWREERGQGIFIKPIPGWQTTLEQRGFVGCARHFIDCVQNQTVPETAGAGDFGPARRGGAVAGRHQRIILCNIWR